MHEVILILDKIWSSNTLFSLGLIAEQSSSAGLWRVSSSAVSRSLRRSFRISLYSFNCLISRSFFPQSSCIIVLSSSLLLNSLNLFFFCFFFFKLDGVSSELDTVRSLDLNSMSSFSLFCIVSFEAAISFLKLRDLSSYFSYFSWNTSCGSFMLIFCK